MRLYSASEVVPDGTGLLCRQSRVGGILGYAVICLLLGGAPVVWWLLEAPWPVWGGCALLAVVVVPLLVSDLVQRLHPSNWVLWIRPDGLWINFRSYQDKRPPDDMPAVAHVEFSEIDRVQPLVESYSTPTGHGNSSVRHREESLLIQLKESEGSVLQEALAAERSRMPAERVVLGFIRVASKASHFAVSMAAPTTIHIAWRGGHGNHVVPGLERVLDHVGRVAGIQLAVSLDPLREDRRSWDEMDDRQLDELIQHLVDTGARIDASRLLVKRKGYSTTEARRRIEELARRSDHVPRDRSASAGSTIWSKSRTEDDPV